MMPKTSCEDAPVGVFRDARAGRGTWLKVSRFRRGIYGSVCRNSGMIDERNRQSEAGGGWVATAATSEPTVWVSTVLLRRRERPYGGHRAASPPRSGAASRLPKRRSVHRLTERGTSLTLLGGMDSMASEALCATAESAPARSACRAGLGNHFALPGLGRVFPAPFQISPEQANSTLGVATAADCDTPVSRVPCAGAGR